MCCGEAFWKRVVVFCLTFGLGVFVAGWFVSGKVPAAVKPLVVPAAEENKNCVPSDKSLRYETLEGNKPYAPYKFEKPAKPELKKPEDKKKSLKDENAKLNNTAEPQYYNPSKDPAEVQDLLHKERCFDAQSQ